MEMMPLTPERKAQLDDYAERHGQDPVAALDNVLTDYLDWERQDFEQAVEAIGAGYEDVKNGCTRPAEEFLDELRRKYGFPG
jgi:predicted transcriptional regulator